MKRSDSDKPADSAEDRLQKDHSRQNLPNRRRTQRLERQAEFERLQEAERRSQQLKREERRSKQQSTRDLENRLREILRVRGIPFPVRVEFADQAAPTTHALPDDIQDCGNGLYLVDSSNGERKYKVQKKGRRWTCGCPKWMSQRGIDCQHIKKVRQALEGGGPYSNARRNRSAIIIYEANEKAEATRRAEGYEEMPSRLPTFFKELCLQIRNSVVKDVCGEGAPPVPLLVRAYCMLCKVAHRFTYAQLAHHLRHDPIVRELGWTKGSISQRTLVTICGDMRITPALKKMIEQTGATARDIETTAILDGSGMPGSIAANYNEDKHGVGKNKKRKSGRYRKMHWSQGRVTNLIASVDLSNDFGLGSGDAPHYERVAKGTKKIWARLERFLGDAAYGNPGNYNRTEPLSIQLITRERTHEDRSTWGGQAAEVARMQHENPAEYDDLYRYRSKGEIPPSRLKRHQSYQLLRRRLTDITPVQPASSAGDDTLCDLPEDELNEILDRAEQAVGVARRNELYAMVVAANVREVIMLEHLHAQRVSLAAGSAFHPMPIVTITEAELKAS